MNETSSKVSFCAAQEQVHSWVQQFKDPYWPPTATVSKLAEELGEVAKLINTSYGPGKPGPAIDKQALQREVGDMLVLLACLANSQGISLEEAWNITMEKNTKRDLSRWK